MRFYQATTFLFPRSYERRILFVCFGAVHVPLIACIVLQATTGHWQLDTLLTLLVATLVGTGLGLAAIHALLAPIAQATTMLQSIQMGERIAAIPQGADDLVGRLLRGVTTAAHENAARIERLVDAAERDPLTGIRNRRGFLDSAKQILRGRSNAVLALIDIDHFKRINDRFGHAIGDEVLKAVAAAMREVCRDTDTLGRYGGEEFAVLLQGIGEDHALPAAERLRRAVSSVSLRVGDQTITPTASVGVACLTPDDKGFDTLLIRADRALYKAKAEGRDRVVLAGDIGDDASAHDQF